MTINSLDKHDDNNDEGDKNDDEAFVEESIFLRNLCYSCLAECTKFTRINCVLYQFAASVC